jgi:hypothetical protein
MVVTGTAHALSTHPANSCTTNNFGLLCIDTSGGGTFVGSVSASLVEKLPVPTGNCNKEFKLFGTNANGQVFEHRSVAGCGTFRVHTVFALNRNLASGPALCAGVRDNSSPANAFNPGVACVTVRG